MLLYDQLKQNTKTLTDVDWELFSVTLPLMLLNTNPLHPLSHDALANRHTPLLSARYQELTWQLPPADFQDSLPVATTRRALSKY